MDLSSLKQSLDNRLLSVEELFRQGQKNAALDELSELHAEEFEKSPTQMGVYYYLRAEAFRYEGNYRNSIELGMNAARLLANSPLNLHYARLQLVLSRSYLAIGDVKSADIRGRDALSGFRRVSDTAGHVDSLNALGQIAFVRCDYQSAVAFLEDALALIVDNPIRAAVISGNLARIRIHTGDWCSAENDLSEAITHNIEQGNEINQARNLLSLGYLQMRSRRFILAGRSLDKSLEIIGRLDLTLEKGIFLEYSGELALARGDIYKAKAILDNAYTHCVTLGPESHYVSQSSRLLADAELALDNIDGAMKYGQKALEVSTQVGEKVEIGLSCRIIAQVFAAKNDFDSATENIERAVELVSEVGDVLELARTLLVLNEIRLKVGLTEADTIRSTYEQARRLFKQLELDYWVAEVDFLCGVFECRLGNLGIGTRKLNKAEKLFVALNNEGKSRAVYKFLKELGAQAVALSVSQENEFKIFGNLISPSELSDLKSGRLEEILAILLKRTNGDRGLVYSPEFGVSPVEATFSLTPHQVRRFKEKFQNLLGEEISKTKPTLMLDCRRDPFINELFADAGQTVASVVFVPFKMSDNSTSYLYVDKLCHDNGINPFSQTELNFAVGFSDVIALKWAEMQKNKLLEDNLRLKGQLREKAAFPNIITQNSEMLDLLTQVRQVINSNISITIEGETGTGKDVLVRAIHYNSDRHERRFISVNCAALPETLLESELFGYKRGAFTGADHDKSGLFEEADGGTFFLDEIGDMPLNIQAKVLRVLEEKELVRLGETTPRSVDVRIISATNRDLRELMSSRLFRQDLYYRLSGLTFRLPPLRERREDIPLLVNHFLGDCEKQVSAEVMKALVSYDWPGNVRELENEIKKLVLLAGDCAELRPELLSGRIADAVTPARAEKARKVDSTEDIVFDETYTLYDYLAHHEKRFIIRALKEKNGVKKHAAKLLNIPESTLRLKIKQYGISLKNLKPC